jgi:hypothetical protein
MCKFLTILSLTVGLKSCTGKDNQKFVFNGDGLILLAQNQSSFLVFLHPFLGMLILLSTSNLEQCVGANDNGINLRLTQCQSNQNDFWQLF